MKEKSVFISYSRKDKSFVDKLASDLNKEGVKTWVDVQQINPGELWEIEIRKGIENSEIFLAVLSDNYISSSWTSIEIALANKKKIIPIKISQNVSENIPKVILEIQWIDFNTGYTAGFEQILKLLPENFINQRPIKPKKEISKGYVFISFCEEDGSFVEVLREFLKSQEFAYWDFEESDRNYNVQFFHELEDVIHNSEAVLSIISPDWRNSKWSTREFFFAEEIGKPIVLLMSKSTKPTLAISGHPYIDFTADQTKGFSKLERELIKRLN